MTKEYKCECGKVFDNPQKFNGHKSHCKVHLIAVGKLDKVTAAHRQAGITTSSINKQKFEERQKELKNQWISQQHRCKRCGKIMFVKFGSGDYCSSSCANSHQKSDATKRHLSSVAKDNAALLKAQKIDEYNLNPSKCVVCGNALPYNKRNNQTCSIECRGKLISVKSKHTRELQGKHIQGRHIVYKVTSLLDGRYYIGVRKTNIEFDGYLGSGILIGRLVKKYGKENFTRKTLFEFDNSTDAFNKEKELLKEHLHNPLCVNIASGGQGGKTH